jgi:hypothetical protein
VVLYGGAIVSVRIYVAPRVSVEPEFLYLHNSPNDQDYLIQPSVANDLTGSTKRFVPYVGIQARVDANIRRYRARFCKRSNLLIPN